MQSEPVQVLHSGTPSIISTSTSFPSSLSNVRTCMFSMNFLRERGPHAACVLSLDASHSPNAIMPSSSVFVLFTNLCFCTLTSLSCCWRHYFHDCFCCQTCSFSRQFLQLYILGWIIWSCGTMPYERIGLILFSQNTNDFTVWLTIHRPFYQSF